MKMVISSHRKENRRNGFMSAPCIVILDDDGLVCYNAVGASDTGGGVEKRGNSDYRACKDCGGYEDGAAAGHLLADLVRICRRQACGSNVFRRSELRKYDREALRTVPDAIVLNAVVQLTQEPMFVLTGTNQAPADLSVIIFSFFIECLVAFHRFTPHAFAGSSRGVPRPCCSSSMSAGHRAGSSALEGLWFRRRVIPCVMSEYSRIR